MAPLPLEDGRLATLSDADSSARLRAAMALGAAPDTAFIDPLIERCAVEPDFFVREMLTWALNRFPSSLTVPKLLPELRSANNQARSQALHTLSKIQDPSAWPAITKELLRDADDEVARTAWRAAVALVPLDERKTLAEELALQFGRGPREVQLSLSRALIALGELFVEPVLRRAQEHPEPQIRAHAKATERLLRNPNAAFDLDPEQ